MPAKRPKKTAPKETIAFRLHAARLLERFTQEEIAGEIGLSREAYSTYETGRVAVPTGAALAFCRRLDISLRWLATGEEPMRPFVSPSEFKVAANILEAAAAGGVPFAETYPVSLAKPSDAWHAKNGIDVLVMRQLREGPAGVMRRLSLAELKDQIARLASLVTKGEEQIALIADTEVLEAAVVELRHRLRERSRI